MERKKALSKIIFCVLMTIPWVSFGQDNNSNLAGKSFVGMSFNVNSPLGDFKNSLGDEKRLNSPGLNLTVDAGSYINPYLGLGGEIGMFTNYTANCIYFEEFVSMLKEEDEDYKLSSPGRWENYKFLFGPYTGIKEGKFSLELRVLGGINHTYIPGTMLKIKDGENKTTKIKVSANRGWGLAYEVGANFGFYLTDQVVLTVNSSYYDAKVNLLYDKPVYDESGEMNAVEENCKKEVEVFSVGIGLSHRF